MNRQTIALAIAAALSAAATPWLAKAAVAAAPAKAVKAPAAAKATRAVDSPVDPDAVEALRRMSAYLMTLKAFELKADTTVDLVTESGQRLQLGGVSTYKVRTPDAFQIVVTNDMKDRRYYYDGKQFTIFAPSVGFYASAAAPPTIKQTLELVYQKYGIVLPLDDLFRWNTPESVATHQLSSGYLVGPGMVDGVLCDHYAFRQLKKDWEVWIEQGERPLPRKLVIVDRSDPAGPGYSARLAWTLNPTLAASDFTFVPAAGNKAITLAGKAK